MALTVGLLTTAACHSVHDDLSRALLEPPADWLVSPTDLGFAAEPFEVVVDDGSLSGFFVRAEHSGGRTVVLFHDSRTNVSMLQPYYTFLCAAGLNVCVFDYRGYGHSRGTPGFRAMVNDMPPLLRWLRARSDVDAERIAFYGLSIGSVVALHAAAHTAGCAALVLEGVPSPRDAIRTRIEARNQIASAIAVGFAEFAGLPEQFEPAENAPGLSMPSLWLAGANEPAADLQATLRAYFEMGGDKQLWVLPDTGAAPHSLLTHDGEYQRAIATFLCSALAGSPDQVTTSCRPLGTSLAGSGTYEIALGRRTDVAKEPWAVQVCALDANAAPTWAKTWLEGAIGTVRLDLANEPGAISAMRIGDAERTPTGAFARSGTPLSRGGRWYEEHLSTFDRARTERLELAEVRRIAAILHEREQIEALPPLLEAELADAFASIGCALSQSADAEDRAVGGTWLERAIAAVPAHPERHYWPGRRVTAGFPQASAVAAAREVLAKLAH